MKPEELSALLLAGIKRGTTSRRGRVGLAALAAAVLLIMALHRAFPLRVHVDYSPVITAADGSVVNAFLSRDDKWRMQLEPGELNSMLKKAVLLKEDRYFYYHPGFNPVALVRALVQNLRQSKKAAGASTITMQVVRLLYPQERTYGNKLKEIVRALQLEWVYSKDEILALYLNLVPFGGNIEGVKAASVLYFQQSPRQLSLAQAVTLAVIPNKPSSLRIGHKNREIVAFRDKWLLYFARQKAFPAAELTDALAEPLEARRLEAPRVAPHFAYRLRRRYQSLSNIRTTLNRPVQEQVEQLAYNYLQRLKSRNIHNAAVLVVNNQTRTVEAYLGSADFDDRLHGGQVDGVRAIRSPGSTLKPYLYGVAMDRGLVTPRTMISDVPVDYAGYRPENYFGDFSGNITIAQALATSLNVPAVKVLDRLGVPVFVQKLQQAGFSRMKKDGHQLGLSLILGGCDVRLEELTALYATLANGGVYAPLRWRPEEKPVAKRRLLSPAAAHMVTEILTQLQRPDLPHNALNSAHLPRIAWKTGTSYGRRDAWSIGYNQRYTVGVWVGNFSGEGVPELNGTDSATPLLFDIFNTIDYNRPAHWFKPPGGLARRVVCAESGLPLNTFCRSQVPDTYIPGISATEKCSHLKAVPVAPDGQYAFCTSCLPESGFEMKWYPNYAPEILAFFERERLPYVRIPVHNPACSRIFEEQGPVITSPTADMEYWLEGSEKQQLQLRCQAHNEVKQVHWFVNDQFLRAAGSTEAVFFTPRQAGKYKISCTDDQGRNADSYVSVKFLD